MNVSSGFNIETFDTPDVAIILNQINNNFNIMIYLLSVCIGLVFAFAICYSIYKIIKWCTLQHRKENYHEGKNNNHGKTQHEQKQAVHGDDGGYGMFHGSSVDCFC